jgi:hypothetical protein
MNGFTQSYKIEGDELIMTADGTMGTDKFIYVLADLTLSVPLADKDLTVIPHTMFGGEKYFELIYI